MKTPEQMEAIYAARSARAIRFFRWLRLIY